MLREIIIFCFSQLKGGYIVYTWSVWYHLRLILSLEKPWSSNATGTKMTEKVRCFKLNNVVTDNAC